MLEVIVLGLVCAAYLSLAMVVYANSPKIILNRVLAGLMIVTPLWVVTVYLEDSSSARDYLEILAHADYALASVMVGLFYWFCILFTKRRWKTVNGIVWMLAILSVVLSLFGFTSKANLLSGSVVLQPVTPGYQLFLALLLFTFGGGVLALRQGLRGASRRDKAQITIVSTGLILTGISLIVALMVAPRFYDLSDASFTRIGLYGTLFFAIFSAYALVKHRFLDIRDTVARSIAYILLLGVLTLIYVGVAFGLLQVFLGNHAPVDTVQLTIFTAVSISLVVVYAPLKKFFDSITDKIFYRHGYDQQVILGTIGDVTASGMELAHVAEKLMKILKRALTSEYVAMHILPVDAGSSSYYFPIGTSRNHLLTIINSLPAVREEVTIADQLPPDSRLFTAMDDNNVSVIVTLHTSHDTLGYVYLGPKQNGDNYTSRDVNLLDTVADELSLSIQNSIRFQQIQDFNDTLKEKISTATQELRDSNRRLKQIDATKDEFISMASHQLRTPLTSIKGYISMLLEGDLGKVTPEQRKALEEAFTSSQRMVYLIGDFLNLSRLQTGRFELERIDVSLPMIIREEIAQLRATAQSRGIELRYEEPTDFPMVSVDENKIRQVMMNFIDNAIYYSKPSGGVIEVTLMRRHDHEIVFRVKDNGIGVPTAARYQLFTKFYRAGNARKARPDGTGIGLYMAKKVIVAHGGVIIFESKEGEGSTFGFQLPITDNLPDPKHP
ncbi:MAG: ATP-binding protein [Candidatus Saccharimonadales bacterium]